MATKRHVWRPGDKLRVLNPLWVKRVGYPLVWYELMEEVKADIKVGQAWGVLTGSILQHAAGYLRDMGIGPTDGVPRYFLQAAAKALVEARDFGGNERKIIYDDPHGCQCVPGAVLEVYSKRVVKTGTRFAATAGSAGPWGFDEGWEGDPARLADMKTHILLTTACGEIEAANVELVDKPQ